MPNLGPPETPPTGLILNSDLDLILGAQLIVAWAGEEGPPPEDGGEEPRLGWWRSDMVSKYGGADLFEQLTPKTWQWAVFQAAREAAKRKDAELRKRDSNADRLASLFSLGFTLDERVEERLQEHKQSKRSPQEVFPDLDELLKPLRWRPAFVAWVEGHGSADHTPTSVGRRLRGAPPQDVALLVRKLVAGLAPLGDQYPLPHFARAGA